MANKDTTASETIVAAATPPGAGALAIIRVSGPHALTVVKTIFTPVNQKPLKPRELTLGWVQKKGHKIDQAMAVYMPNPNSYTGEDIVEFHLHGSPAIVQTILDQISNLPYVRVAQPGEFTKRAFLNGKIDLLQAEAVAELIASKNQYSAKRASHQLNGALSDIIQTNKSKIIHLSAHYVANLDFSEEDIALIEPNKAKLILQSITKELEHVLKNSQHQNVAREGMKVAFIGLPNAGKSTLLNILLGYDRAIVTSTPGTTRDIITESITINGLNCVINDTAGLRLSKNTVEKAGIERTKKEAIASDHIFLLIEPGKQAATHDYLVKNGLTSTITNKNTTVIFTKADRASQVLTKSFRGFEKLSISSTNPNSIQKIIGRLEKLIQDLDLDSTQLLTKRQKDLITTAINQLKKITNMLGHAVTDDLILVELQQLIETFNLLSGNHTTEEILTEVFSSFCIGK